MMRTTSLTPALRLEGDGAAPRWSWAQRATVATLGLSGAIAAAQFGGTDAGPELCLVRNCTGGWCPGCGGARAAHHLVHGEAAAAWKDHPWVVLAAAQVVVATLVAVLVMVVAVAAPRWAGRTPAAAGRSSPRWASQRGTAVRVALLVNGLLLIAIWFVRMATGSIPSPWSA